MTMHRSTHKTGPEIGIERPIAFNAQMVNAVLEGRKTQTRRVLKKQPTPYSIQHKSQEEADLVTQHGIMEYMTSPYGFPGDKLWVREAWRTGSELDDKNATEIMESAHDAGFTAGQYCPLKYEADGAVRPWGECDLDDFGPFGRYRHGRFMPRWASRILLEVTDVRAERLQAITAADCKAEGIELTVPKDSDGWWRSHFQTLWDSINGEKHPWENNPWVWVVEFRRIKQ
ncbi:MAG: hypothetical protein NXH95_13510 [Pseudomonadaceae bacterium]|nr:hypothetical protein [Pseudomonadaceae bacterium]